MNLCKKIIFFFLLNIPYVVYSQCSVTIDTANIQHVVCPNGGAVGRAEITQAFYINYSWKNLTNGQLYNGGGGSGGTQRNDLDAGLYVITASNPYSSSCPDTLYSDTFEILEATPQFSFSPTQACPDSCNVEVTAYMQIAIRNINYTLSFDSNTALALPFTLDNQCGGMHIYEVFADGNSCGTESLGISQSAQMNLSTNVVNAGCSQLGSAAVFITGLGASGLDTYCGSGPQYSSYSTIDNVSLIGDSNNISNNTSGICAIYSDFTNSFFADVSPDSSYVLNIDLGTCHSGGFSLVDMVKVYVDWNIDGDFLDINELIMDTVAQSPSSHSFIIRVPSSAIPGQTRMRIVMQNSQYQTANQAAPCDSNTAYFGETEDYTIQVKGSVILPISYNWSDGQNTSVATNLNAGLYTVIVTDGSGCTASDTAFVSGPNSIVVQASKDTVICAGGSIDIFADTIYTGATLEWKDSLGSILATNTLNLTVSPIQTTTYWVVVTDTNGCIAQDSVTVTVNPIPTATLIGLPNPACLGDNIILTAASSILVNKYRFQYNYGSGWLNMTTPAWISSNTTNFLNITNSAQFRVKTREDWGCTASSWYTIIVPISSITTSPINHN